ncbi:MAG: glycosyltransferase family 2 protein [Bacteroidetes bacterium]|nr:glycosyltransferase family 2 protein [Bacteroidota bacterium]
MAEFSISVIMAAYNAEEFISVAIDSILNQSFRNFEFIIINDASTDRTLSIINTYNDERIKIITNQKNCGLAVSLNIGIRAATGKYIARMDADDISDLSRFEKQYQFLEENPEIDVCATAMQLFGTENNISGNDVSTDDEIKAELIWGCPTNHATMLMRLDKIKKYNLFYDETFGVGQDWKFWYDVKNYVKIFNFIEPLYLYRRGEQNVTVQFKDKSRERSLRMHKILLADLAIPFTDEDLKIHQFINGLFSLTPSPDNVKKAKFWLKKILLQNKIIKKYEEKTFEATALKKWNHLFFLIVPYGHNTVFKYFLVTGIRWNHLSYYLKYSVNKLIGRK